jgi:hypothetical protein
MHCYLESGHERTADALVREFLQVQFGGFPKVTQRFLDRCALADGSGLGAVGDK